MTGAGTWPRQAHRDVQICCTQREATNAAPREVQSSSTTHCTSLGSSRTEHPEVAASATSRVHALARIFDGATVRRKEAPTVRSLGTEAAKPGRRGPTVLRSKGLQREGDDIAVIGRTADATKTMTMTMIGARASSTGGATASPWASPKVRKAATKCEHKASNVAPNEGS